MNAAREVTSGIEKRFELRGRDAGEFARRLESLRRAVSSWRGAVLDVAFHASASDGPRAASVVVKIPIAPFGVGLHA